MGLPEISLVLTALVVVMGLSQYIEDRFAKASALSSLRAGDDVIWIEDGNIINGTFVGWTVSGLVNVNGPDGPYILDVKRIQRKLS